MDTQDPSDGRLHKFEVDGATFVDGSLVADLPFKRMATLFNVSNFIVSQVNFHVRPFLRKAHTPGRASGYWQILSFLELDIRSRAQALAKLGLLPTFFGQNMSKVFSQKYHGDVTSTWIYSMDFFRKSDSACLYFLLLLENSALSTSSSVAFHSLK